VGNDLKPIEKNIAKMVQFFVATAEWWEGKTLSAFKKRERSEGQATDHRLGFELFKIEFQLLLKKRILILLQFLVTW